MRRISITALVALAALAGCSGDDDEATVDTAEATAGSVEDACAAASVIAGYDDEVEGELQTAISDAIAAGDMTPISEKFRDLTDQGTIDAVVAAYDDLADAVPDDLAAQAETLGDFTAAFFAEVQGAETVEELTAYLESMATDPAAEAAGAASLALDGYLRPTCGISFAD